MVIKQDMVDVLYRPGTSMRLHLGMSPLGIRSKKIRNNHFSSIHCPNVMDLVHKASASSTYLLLFLIEEGKIATISYCIGGSHIT